MNETETIDFVLEFLLRQGGPSEIDGVPKYRDNKGRSCAIGCLIVPGSYDPGIECNTLVNLWKKKRLPPMLVAPDRDVSLGLLAGLQLAHDHAYRRMVSDGLTWLEALELEFDDLRTKFVPTSSVLGPPHKKP